MKKDAYSVLFCFLHSENFILKTEKSPEKPIEQLTEKLAELSVQLGKEITPAKSEAALKKQILEFESEIVNLEQEALNKKDDGSVEGNSLPSNSEMPKVSKPTPTNDENIISDLSGDISGIEKGPLAILGSVLNEEKLKPLREQVAVNSTFSTKHNGTQYNLVKGDIDFIPSDLAYELDALKKVTILA